MSKILIIAEHANGQLNPSTAKTLTAAKQMGAASIDIVVLAADAGNLADLRARQYLVRQMAAHFFGGGADAAQGYVPPSA